MDSLSLAEFQRVLRLLGLDPGTLALPLFQAFDQNGNGYLDFRELFIGISLLVARCHEERLEVGVHLCTSMFTS